MPTSSHITPNGAPPVSYTHLDVYKRQGYNSVHSFREYSGRINVSCTVFFSILYFMGITHFLINGSSGIQSRSAMCAAAFTMCFAINPVPVASSSTVLCRTTGRISSYTVSYTHLDVYKRQSQRIYDASSGAALQ